MSVRAIFKRISESSSATHRKQSQALVKLATTENFEYEFMQCVAKLLLVKKEPGVEKIFKFLFVFFGEIAKSDSSAKAFFNTTLFEKLLLGLYAGNKIVRFRSSQIMALLMNASDDIDEDLFEDIKVALMERVMDKEANVRLHAACALTRLQDCGSDEENLIISEKLLYMLKRDPSRYKVAIINNQRCSKNSLAKYFNE